MGSGTSARVTLYAGRVLVALVSVCVLSFTAYAYVTQREIKQDVVTTDVIEEEVQAEGPKPLDGAVDILLVGMDSRTDAYGNPLPKEVMDLLHAGVNDGERNTDTMILVHIPVDGRRAVAISFPRDSYVEIAGGFGKHKLNSAFVYAFNDSMKAQKGVEAKQAEATAKVAGRKNLIATIEQLVGGSVRIDRYAEVNLGSFYEITKAIGGVEVCLNKPVDDWRSGARFPAGLQTVEGAQALSFVRQRYGLPNGDLDRIVRQQVFIGALARKVLSAGVLTDMGRLGELISAIKKSVVLSSGWDITTFAQQMQGLSSGSIDFHTIPTQGLGKAGGADVVKVDPAEVQRFVAALAGDEGTAPQPSSSPSVTSSAPVQPSAPAAPSSPSPVSSGATSAVQPPPGRITVDVRNASSELRLATAVQGILVGKGFVAGTLGDSAQQADSVIFHRPGDQASAERVTAELGGRFRYAPDSLLRAGQVRVILGQDYPEELDNRLAGQSKPGGTGPAQAVTDPAAPPSDPAATPAPTITADGVTCVN